MPDVIEPSLFKKLGGVFHHAANGVADAAGVATYVTAAATAAAAIYGGGLLLGNSGAAIAGGTSFAGAVQAAMTQFASSQFTVACGMVAVSTVATRVVCAGAAMIKGATESQKENIGASAQSYSRWSGQGLVAAAGLAVAVWGYNDFQDYRAAQQNAAVISTPSISIVK